jgi:hypothetical protein
MKLFELNLRIQFTYISRVKCVIFYKYVHMHSFQVPLNPRILLYAVFSDFRQLSAKNGDFLENQCYDNLFLHTCLCLGQIALFCLFSANFFYKIKT